MRWIIIGWIGVSIFASDFLFAQGPDMERRQQYLKEVLQINIDQLFRENTRRVSVQDSVWTDWLKRSGELPPDFSQMRSTPMLPEPLVQYEDGRETAITTDAQWQKRRDWIKEQYQYWVSGHFPPAPDNLQAVILSDTLTRGVRIQMIQLNFGPGHRAKMTFELMIPQSEQGDEKRPVFMTQWNHRDWAQLAVKRGYIGCVYAGADLRDDTDPYMYIYPDYDFSGLARRAWGASRVVDYLFTRKEVNTDQIAISGHSRNGKQSLWAAAFDERIAAVVSSSSSTGGDMPWRYCDPQYASETLDYVTAWNGHWFHPRLNFFSGREHKLPVDQNLLAALVAPRALLFHYSILESGLNSWSIEQNYYSVKKVYDFMGVPERVGVHTRMGGHLPVPARDVEQTIDFLDTYFKRRDQKWQNQLYFAYDYEDWLKRNEAEQTQAKAIGKVRLSDAYKSLEEWNSNRDHIASSLNWLLGEEPPGIRAIDVGSWPRPQHDWIEGTNPKPVVKGAKAVYISPYAALGDGISAVLYCPADSKGNMMLPESGKIPVIIYSHQYAYSTGFSKGYDKNGRKGTAELFAELVKSGFAVLAIDMYGFGTRIEEAKNFYTRYPKWSKMGKMVRDVRSCIDAAEDLAYLDNDRIYLLGNTIGGSVSLMAAALDSRVAGVALVAAFSPWRTANSQYESIRTYSHLHGFMPRLGFFAGQPEDVPVDFGEIMAMLAPKPVLVVAPDMDPHTDHKALQEMLASVRSVYRLYGKEKQLHTAYPHDINRLSRDRYGLVSSFFVNLTK
ncbi:alpha/beta fold hydrolase [Parapedobacter sp. SGR-10]|uniref:alpha/beta hydrolase n=1 Tax=Parapedobacter sp. SGR-10 TaxID=2710879 RepID=UPI0013D2D17D|nr:alpha/beta fold hydrolase [Parapedobacter sp. SGR-10]NGF56362.1 alpha/beta fold hydrolase [Parapedobacter sp. SGR-10]